MRVGLAVSGPLAPDLAERLVGRGADVVVYGVPTGDGTPDWVARCAALGDVRVRDDPRVLVERWVVCEGAPLPDAHIDLWVGPEGARGGAAGCVVEVRDLLLPPPSGRWSPGDAEAIIASSGQRRRDLLIRLPTRHWIAAHDAADAVARLALGRTPPLGDIVVAGRRGVPAETLATELDLLAARWRARRDGHVDGLLRDPGRGLPSSQAGPSRPDLGLHQALETALKAADGEGHHPTMGLRVQLMQWLEGAEATGLL